LAFAILILFSSDRALGANGDGALGASATEVLQEYCIRCHGDSAKEGEIDFASPDSFAALRDDADRMRDVVDAMDLAFMPPDGEPQPSSEERQILLRDFRRLLTESLKQVEYPRTPIRRMNRFQYNNAVQDLLELKVVVFALPERMLRDYGYFQPETGRMPEKVMVGNRPLGKSQLIEPHLDGVAPFPQDLRAEHGFDNRGDHLSLSPLLMESFFRLARSIVESKDFTRKNIGRWDQLYAEPNKLADDNDAAEAVGERIEARLRPFLTHAFRRVVDEKTLRRYVNFAAGLHQSGKPLTDCMKEVTVAVLCSPRFLYLHDGATTGPAPERLSDYELASRLSFFLWGSIPDQQLLTLAKQGELGNPSLLEEQVDRMLRDRKLKRFCDSFPAQWLQLEQIIASVPDRKRFSHFYFGGANNNYRASMHLALEPLLLFETVLVENRPITQLIDSDFSYRSELVDTWCRNDSIGMIKKAKKPVVKLPFRRVEVNDRRYGGVITTPAIMTMTSAPDRTKPITRGAWLATVIFNSPPPPPPADVPPLPDEDQAASANEGHGPIAPLSLRERVKLHQTRADCASCHQKIDSLGFALENFGPVGEWREEYSNGANVDNSGVLFNRHEFKDIVEFKDAILKEEKRFAKAFASHLLSFSLGRKVFAADQKSVDQIVATAGEAEFRLQAFIKQVVMCEAFGFKYNPTDRLTETAFTAE
jgi:hypothetical protein